MLSPPLRPETTITDAASTAHENRLAVIALEDFVLERILRLVLGAEPSLALAGFRVVLGEVPA
ncbi:hypothetical protein [Bacteroides clarus]